MPDLNQHDYLQNWSTPKLKDRNPYQSKPNRNKNPNQNEKKNWNLGNNTFDSQAFKIDPNETRTDFFSRSLDSNSIAFHCSSLKQSHKKGVEEWHKIH